MLVEMKLNYDIREGIGYIAMENPPQNALTRPDFEDPAVLERFLDDAAIKGVVLSGAGRNFSSGADLEALRKMRAEDPAAARAALNRGKDLLQKIRRAPVPVLALIRGSCLGGGLEIALACHFRFASANAMLGFPEAEHGLLPGMGGTRAVWRELGTAGAMSLVLSGKMVRPFSTWPQGFPFCSSMPSPCSA